MAKTDFTKAMNDLLEEDDKSSAKSKLSASSLPTIDQRVDLYLRAVHGSKTVTAAERKAARARILDGMAAELSGEALEEFEAAPAAPSRARAPGPSGFSQTLKRAGEALRDGLFFPLIGSTSGPRLVALSCAALLVAGGAWTATWFYAARNAEMAVASLIASEAKAGRNYSCGSQKVGGFPLRVEISCTGFKATIAASEQSTLTVNATALRATASLLAPGTLTTTMTGPVSVAESQQATSYVGTFKVAQITLQGPAANPEQVSLIVDDPDFRRVSRGAEETLVAGGRLEFDAKAAGQSGARVVNIAARAIDMSLPQGGLITSRPFVADLAAVLRDGGSAGSPIRMICCSARTLRCRRAYEWTQAI